MLERHVYVYFTQILKLANDPTLLEIVYFMVAFSIVLELPYLKFYQS